MNFQETANAPQVGHFYTPLPYFKGEVLKYGGIATEANKVWVVEKNPGTIIVPEYIADRINAKDHTEFKG